MRVIQTENKEFFVTSEIENEAKIELCSSENGVSVYALSFALEGEREVPKIAVKWKEPMLGVLSMWGPDLRRNRELHQWAIPQKNRSSFYQGAPVFAFVNQNSKNYSTVALSEGEYPVTIEGSVNDFEEKDNLDFECTLFGNGERLKEYTCYLRIDNDREKPFCEAIMAVSGWWNEFYPNDNPPTVVGEYPLYSSWYNYHQHPESFTMEKELEVAAAMGFQSVIIDDGWSYDGLGTADYFNCGSWEIAQSKFPDFKGFIDKAHALGLKVALWFPVPYVGFNNPDFEAYRDVMLYLSDDWFGAPIRAGVLDPRYKKARDYIVDGYRKIVYKYGLDGLKLDFIDSFHCYDPALLGKNCGGAVGRDCDSVEEGAIKLLEEIRAEFCLKNPDFMIEFRQRYFGPSITRFCNMLRVGDCPFELIKNRMGVLDLRLLNYNLAVHSDMLYWSNGETLENCALQLLNILFGVPQISVLVTKIPVEQFELIKKYIGYWKENRAVILHGKLTVSNPEYNYTFASAESENKRIAVSYLGNFYAFDGKQTDLFNASETSEYVLENRSGRLAKIAVYDCLGGCLGEYELAAGALIKIPVKTASKIVIE